MIRLYGKGSEKLEYVGLRPGEKLYEELLLDKETDRATEKDRIYVTEQETVEWETVEGWLRELEDCLDKHQDVKAKIQEMVTFQGNFRFWPGKFRKKKNRSVESVEKAVDFSTLPTVGTTTATTRRDEIIIIIVRTVDLKGIGVS